MPDPSWPELAKLVKVEGSASLVGLNPALTSTTIDLKVTVTNLTPQPVVFEHMRVRQAYTGGAADEPATSLFAPGQMFGKVPMQLAGNAKLLGHTPNFWAGLGPSHVVIDTLVTDGGAQRQLVTTPIPILAAGAQAPPALSTPVPVYLGLWTNPAEVVPVWVGGKQTHWITVAGQLINGSGRAMQILSWHLRLEAAGQMPLDLNPKLEFYRHDNSGHALLPVAADGTVTSQEELTFFIHGQEVAWPAGATTGTLKVWVTYLIDGSLRHVEYTSPAALLAPVAVRSPVQGSPVQGKWFWGNAPDHTGWDAHAWPGQRFAYDLVVRDANGSTFISPDKMQENTNYYSWDQPVLSLGHGTVVEVHDGTDDNNGNAAMSAALAKQPPNYVLIAYGFAESAGFYHLKKGSITVAPGDAVTPGQVIGKVGNSAAFGPHLHFGYVRKDNTGRGLLVPMRFTNLKTTTGTFVTVTPGAGEYTS